MRSRKKNKKKKNTQHKINKNLHDLKTGRTHYCVEVFQIIMWKERTVYVLSKNLHQSVPYAQNESCLAYKETENG